MDNPKLPLIENARNLVNASSLTPEDKKVMIERLPYAPTPLLQVFLDTCGNDPEMLDLVIKNLKRKLLAGDNPEKLRAIIAEERKELRDLIHQHA